MRKIGSDKKKNKGLFSLLTRTKNYLYLIAEKIYKIYIFFVYDI